MTEHQVRSKMTPVTKTGLNPSVAGAHPAIEVGRYTVTAQALHWLTVFLILMILPIAWVMMSLPTGPEQDRMLVFHRSLGVTILAVAVIRLAWRSTHPPPPLPSTTPRVMELISQLTHWLLYALQSWARESGQVDKWIFCLTTARLAEDQEIR
jgi:cytochrome b